MFKKNNEEILPYKVFILKYKHKRDNIKQKRIFERSNCNIKL